MLSRKDVDRRGLICRKQRDDRSQAFRFGTRIACRGAWPEHGLTEGLFSNGGSQRKNVCCVDCAAQLGYVLIAR